MNYRKEISIDTINRLAPSVLATAPHPSRSERYSFVSSADIMEALKQRDWLPVQAVESRVRKDQTRKGFQKHMIRFAHREALESGPNVGESNLEILLRNAMDGTSRFQLDLGVYRLICGNGMVVSDGEFNFGKFKHQGLDDSEIIDVTFKVIEAAPMIQNTMEKWKAIELNQPQREAFAHSALIARYGEESLPVRPEQILRPRRWSDKGSNLWHTFNTVQEHLIKGGAKQNRYDMERGQKKRASVRAVKSVDGDVNLNKALWQLSAKMAELINNN